MPFAIRPASEEDLPQLTEIEREAFPTNWPPTPFKRDLTNNRASVLVAYETQAGGHPSGRGVPRAAGRGPVEQPRRPARSAEGTLRERQSALRLVFFKQ